MFISHIVGFPLPCLCIQELSDHLPHFAVLRGAVQEEEADSQSDRNKNKLTLLQWTIAFQRFALAAAAIEIDKDGRPMWQLASSMAHADICFQERPIV